jgi:hypothetical protein
VSGPFWTQAIKHDQGQQNAPPLLAARRLGSTPTRSPLLPPPFSHTQTNNTNTQTHFGGPGAPCTLLQSEALDLRVLLDCGAKPLARPGGGGGGLALRAPNVHALLKQQATTAGAGAPSWPFVDAILLTSPAAALGLPLLYRAAADAQAAQAAAEGGDTASTSNTTTASLLPALPLHTYATEACLEIAEHWVAELLDAERRRARGGGAAAAAAGEGGGRAATTATTRLTPLFSARDAQRALACVRPVRFGERLTLPGGGRVVAEALPASGARLGVAAWRLRVGAAASSGGGNNSTRRLLYLGPCSSSLRGHAAPLDLAKALEGTQALVLGPGALDLGAGGNPDDGQEEGRERERVLAEADFEETAKVARMLVGELDSTASSNGRPARPRPPLLEQSLRAGVDWDDAMHAAAMHRAAQVAFWEVLDARREAMRAQEAAAAAADEKARAGGAAAREAKAAAAAAARAAAEAAAAALPAVAVAVDPTGAAFDFLEALEQAAQMGFRGAEGGAGKEEEEEEEDDEAEEEGQLRPKRPPKRRTAPVRALYCGPAAEGSLALALSAAEFLSPGRLSRVVRRAAAPFAHGRMMMVGEGGGGGQDKGEGGEGGGVEGKAGGDRHHHHHQRRGGCPVVELRVAPAGSERLSPDVELVLVPAARLLACSPADAARLAHRKVLLLGGTPVAAAAAAAAEAAATSAVSAAAGGSSLRMHRCAVRIPGERGLPAVLLAKALAAMPRPLIAVAAASSAEAQALQQALALSLSSSEEAGPRRPPPPTVVCFAAAAAVPLPVLPPPLYEAWLSGPLAARAVLSPLPPLPSALVAAAARLPRVRVSSVGGGGGRGAWRIDDEEEQGEQGEGGRCEAAVVAALQRGGYEVVERREQEEEEEEEEEEEQEEEEEEEQEGERRAAVVLRVRASAAAAADAGEAEVRLRQASRGGAQVLVLSDDALLRERLRGMCEAGGLSGL